MPVARTENLNMYYEIIGQGQPLVMIRGIGSNADHWYEQVPVLSKKYQLLVFDNRAIARSSDPGGSFSTRDMATDTVGLMEAVGIKKAHVLGYSMGGMIAQELALAYPAKIKGLILVATDCGASLRIEARPEYSRLFTEMIRLGTIEAKTAAAGCLFAKQTFESRPDIIFACGPMEMIACVAGIADKLGVACQVSIEAMMACGMGACLGCAVAGRKSSDKYLHACLNGPVFDIRELKF